MSIFLEQAVKSYDILKLILDILSFLFRNFLHFHIQEKLRDSHVYFSFSLGPVIKYLLGTADIINWERIYTHQFV